MTTDSTAVRNALRTFILQSFLPGEDPANLRDDTPLRASGILDSISTLKLVTHVEDTFNIIVEPHEASTEFDSIDSIASLIGRKQ